MRKSVGDEVRLRWIDDVVPQAGNVLETSTGRQYLVTSVHGKRLTCLVVRKDRSQPRQSRANVLMHWLSRRKR